MSEKRGSCSEHGTVTKTRTPVVICVGSWLKDNVDYFKPPVCNKFMHDSGLLKVMFVGGPNQRKDYHVEQGEELFFMVKGDMCLKVMECGEPKDIIIKEGEIFRLPSRIPHSPQRQADTIGFVMERERDEGELDALRYYCENQNDILYEEWFHPVSLVVDLPPIIKRFFDSEQSKTGKPIPGSIKPAPYPLREERLQSPRSLKEWLAELSPQLEKDGKATLYSEGEVQLHAWSKGEHSLNGEMWLWQFDGQSKVCLPKVPQTTLEKDGSLFVPANTTFTIHCGTGILLTYTFIARHGN